MANLQEWAYNAAGGGALMSSYRQQEHEALMRLVDEVKDWGLNNAKKTGDYSQLAKQVIDNNGGLPPAEYDALQDQLMNEHKNEYLGPEGEPPDNQTQARKLNEIRQIAEEYDGYASYRDGLAKALLEHKKNPGVSGLSNAFMKDKKSKAILELLDPSSSKLSQMKCPEGEECNHRNNIGVYLPDWETIDQTEKAITMVDNEISFLLDSPSESGNEMTQFDDELLLDALNIKRSNLQKALGVIPNVWTPVKTLEFKEVDKQTQGVLFTAAQTAYNVAFNSNSEDNIPFNRAHNQHIVDNVIIGKGDFDSMWYDEMIPGRILDADLVSYIMGPTGEGTEIKGRTYADLGVTPEQLEGVDMNVDGIVDENEARIIVDAIKADTTKDSSGKTPSQRHLSAYLLQHLEDQHNYGVANRPKSKINIDNEENERDEDDIVERRRRRDDIIPQTLNTDYA